jgi:hypothetical protein
MGPKTTGKGGGKGKSVAKGGSKEFNQQVQADLHAALHEGQAGDPCPRCNGYTHGVLVECWDRYKAQDHWTIGKWKYEVKAEKKKVEDSFQEQRKARIDGGFNPKFKPVSPSPPAATAAGGAATLASRPKAQSLSVQASSHASSSRSAPPAPVKKRTPFETKDLGTSLYIKKTEQPGAKPKVPRDGVPQVKTTLVGPKAGKDEFEVIANYVQVQQLPDTLHVYSLTFWRPGRGSPTNRVELNKQREIKLVFEALMAADAFRLEASAQSWATDFKDLWSTTAMSNGKGDKKEWDTPSVTCKLLDGKDYEGVFASVKFSGVLNKIRQRMCEEDITAMSDDIRALNAYVARCIREHNIDVNRPITQLGANKFYVDDGFTVMQDRSNDAGLRAVRGYYTSIRPGAKGPLLNINVATTAFIKPCLVSEMLSLIRDPVYVERMLRGARVRIVYKRQEFEETKKQGYSMNDSLPRTKVFQQFGETANFQKFFAVLEKSDPSGERSIGSNDRGTTVLQYFKGAFPLEHYVCVLTVVDMNVQIRGTANYDMLCVNVGKRVRSFPTGKTMPEEKGTARSAHYYVLHNDAGIGNPDLQKLTLMLCYTFGRSTTGVSYAAPAYIADRLCERGRAYIREWAEDKFALPVFDYKSYQDAQGRVRKPTNAEMAVEKTAMVRQLLTQKGFWGMYNDTGPKDKQRLNPWHPNLDDGMFWM